MIKNVVRHISKSARVKKGNIFIKYLKPDNSTKILDLGGGDGGHIAQIVPFRDNVYIADIFDECLIKAKEKGFKTIKLNEDEKLPFNDDEFDIVFSSSVIEHVTINKNEIYECLSNKEFYKKSKTNQKWFANEIRRVGKKYFVQTP